MARENDFSWDVKLALEKRAGHRCSFPSCNCPTDGPSREGAEATSKTGMACHIVAAADGKSARRKNSSFSPKLTSEQIKDADNGIWLCYSHGKLIDTDEKRFTVEMLKTWREIACLRRQIYQETGKDPAEGFAQLAIVPLARERLEILADHDENTLIGQALEDCATGSIWGPEFANQARDVLIEVTRNALSHGDATKVTVEIEAGRICYSDDGKQFDPLSLATCSNGDGGKRAIFTFIEHHGVHAVLAYQWLDSCNHLVIGRPRLVADVATITPCRINFERSGRHFRLEKHPQLDCCSVLYIILPPYYSSSDTGNIEKEIREQDSQGKQLVFVVKNPARSVLDILTEKYPRARIMQL